MSDEETVEQIKEPKGPAKNITQSHTKATGLSQA
jgi:hypothetical protein